MASPIGHSLAGFLGFFLVAENAQFLKYYSSKRLIITAILIANLPDIDFILGYLLYQDFNIIHRQFTHSVSVGFIVCIIIYFCLRFSRKIPYLFIVWLWGLYFSHILSQCHQNTLKFYNLGMNGDQDINRGLEEGRSLASIKNNHAPYLTEML